MIISVVNQKGGVGKTTTVINLGAALAEAGYRVLLVDLDVTQQSLLRQSAGVTTCRTVASPAQSLRADLKQYLQDSEAVDFILLDCPPTLGPEVAAALQVADLALAPLVPERPALEGLAQLMKTIDVARVRTNAALQLRILITMCDARDPNARAIATQVRKQLGETVLLPTVNRSPVFSRAALARQSVLQTSPSSHGAAAYRATARILSGQVSGQEHYPVQHASSTRLVPSTRKSTPNGEGTCGCMEQRAGGYKVGVSVKVTIPHKMFPL